MIVATIQQKVILPYKQFDTGSTAPYVYAILISENEALLYNPSTGKFELKTLSVSGHSHTFSSITDKPTTIGSYGITDAYTKSEVNSLINDIDLSNYYTKTEIDNKGYLTSLPSHNHDTRYYTKNEVNTLLNSVTVDLSNYYTKTEVDNKGYLTSLPEHNHDSLYLKLSGGTLTGTLNGTSGNFQTLSASTSLTLNGRVLTIRTL